jgi:uncharacterized membrane protein
MLLFSFWNILSSILFVIIAYVIFTNQMQNTSKIIMIILLFVLGIFIFMNMNLFQDYNGMVNNVTDATQTIRVPRDTINNSNGQYSISMWIYVNDWNYKFGKKKTILKRENVEKKQNPHIYLDPYKNDMIVDFYINDSSDKDVSNNYEQAKLWCSENTQDISDELLECNFNPETGEYMASTSGVRCVDEVYECLDGTLVDIENNSCDSINNEHSSTLKNIPLQKWFNVSYGFGDNHVDTYMNGKLVKTKTFNGVQFMSEFDHNDIFICSDGGYSGSISKTSYYNYLVSPDKAYKIYKEGFNPVVVGSLFSKYNASVTFYEDNNERAKYYIV